MGFQGPMGPMGPPGAGMTLVDGNDVALGKVVSMDRTTVTFVTSTGYLMSTRWDGFSLPAQMYYTEACATGGNPQGGQAYLNDGNIGGLPTLGTGAVFSGSFNSWVVPANVSQGYATSVPLTALAADNPTCGTTTPNKKGWLLERVSLADLGLPASATPNQLVLPLTAS